MVEQLKEVEVMEQFRPLPEYLTIKESGINGLGLFATKNIPAGLCIGTSHVYDIRFQNNYLRTAIGSFYNHSETPNCKSVKLNGRRELHTIRDIYTNEELVVDYRLQDDLPKFPGI